MDHAANSKSVSGLTRIIPDFHALDIAISQIFGWMSYVARTGASPEVWRVTFEQSTNGVDYTALGPGTRISSGWQLSGLALPLIQNIYVRARGDYITGQYNGSGSVVESVLHTYLIEPPAITSANSAVFSVGVASSFTVTATGTPTPTITQSGTLPSSITFVDNGNGNAPWQVHRPLAQTASTTSLSQPAMASCQMPHKALP